MNHPVLLLFFALASLIALPLKVYTQDGKLVFSTNAPTAILEYDVPTGTVTPLVDGNLNEVLGIAADTVHRKLYWTNNPPAGAATIGQSDLNGANRITLNIPNLVRLTDIAVDYINQKLVWVDNGTQKIMRSDLGGGNVQTLLTAQKPVGLAINCTFNKIYWTEQGSNPGGGKVKRMDTDGQNPEQVVVYDGRPVKIAFDCIENTMLWTDNLKKQIKTSDPGGLNPTTLLSFIANQDPYGIAIDQDAGIVYYIDHTNDQVNSFVLETGQASEVLTETNPYALHRYEISPLDAREPEANPLALTIWPNPATRQVLISVNTPASADIYSIDGRLWRSGVLQQGANSIPVDGLPAGVYFLRATYKNQTSQARFVKM